MYSLAGLILRNIVGRLIVGMALIIGGIWYGTTSHSSPYLNSHAQNYKLHVMDDGRYLFQSEGTDIFYIIKPKDFNPRPTDNNLKGPGSLKIIYKADQEEISYTSVDNVEVTGKGYQVESFETADENGQNDQTFKNAEYLQYPKGAYTNNWPLGAGLASAGLLLVLLSVLLPLFRRSRSTKSAYPMGQNGNNAFSIQPGPNANPYNLNSNPYNPYQTTPPSSYPSNPNQLNPYAPSQGAVPDPYAQTQNPPQHPYV